MSNSNTIRKKKQEPATQLKLKLEGPGWSLYGAPGLTAGEHTDGGPR